MKTKIAGAVITTVLTLAPLAGIYAADASFFPAVSPDTTGKVVDVQDRQGSTKFAAFYPSISPSPVANPVAKSERQENHVTTRVAAVSPAISPRL